MRKAIIFLCVSVLMLTACNKAKNECKVGSIERDTLLGVPCCVYLPYGYEKEKDIHYPVLYLQHGMYGSEDDWKEQGHLLVWMDSLLQEGAVKEMVIIMPDNFLGSIPVEERGALLSSAAITPEGEPIDTSKGSAHWRKLTADQERGYEMSGYWESHFAEFMHEAEKRYRISHCPSERAIAGLSMGGFHSMHVSHYLHGEFGYIGLFSPAIRPANSNEVYDNWEEEVRAAMRMKPLYWIGIGNEDFLYEYVKEYRQWLEENHLEYTYYESAGGHTWPNWEDYLCRFLEKLFKD
jgi:enterochelin esterase family protein